MSSSRSSLSPPPPAAKRKKHVESKWQRDWTKYRMAPSSKGATYAFCTVCNVDFSVAGGGVHEVKRHCGSGKHQNLLEGLVGQPSIVSVLPKAREDSLREKALKSEIYFVRFIAEHNLPFATADHFTKLCKLMFPDSRVAEAFSCARTKTAALVTHALGPAADSAVTVMCQKQPFTILCDGGNDNFAKKYFCVMVKLWDDGLRRSVVHFLDCPVCNIATGETLFQALSMALEDRCIPWKSVIGYASDSASVMVGRRNSVLSRVIQQQPEVFSLGCVCHLAALCAAAAIKKIPIPIDGLLIDIYYHFKHSSKRYYEFAEILQEFEGIATLNIVKHCPTRWLSLERAVKRLLLLWPALRAYFDRERTTNARASRVADSLMSPETKVWFHFVAFALKPLNAFNTTLQTSSSKIGTMQRDMCQLLRTFLSNFIRPECLTTVTDNEISDFDYRKSEFQVCNEELAIGTATRLLLEEEADTLEGTRQEAVFFAGVKEFYHEAVRKMLDKFPFHNETIRDLAILDPRNRLSVTAASVSRLVRRFMQGTTVDDHDQLQKELRDFKSMPENQLPDVDIANPCGLDNFWADMSDIKQPGNLEEKRFQQLSDLCKVLLVLPHSTADPERLFSMIKKIETDQRNSISPSTLCNLLSMKINTDLPCFESSDLFTPDLLMAAKTATERSLHRDK